MERNIPISECIIEAFTRNYWLIPRTTTVLTVCHGRDWKQSLRYTWWSTLKATAPMPALQMFGNYRAFHAASSRKSFASATLRGRLRQPNFPRVHQCRTVAPTCRANCRRVCFLCEPTAIPAHIGTQKFGGRNVPSNSTIRVCAWKLEKTCSLLDEREFRRRW